MYDYFKLQVFPWPSMSTQEASNEIRRLLEGPFATHIGRGDLNRATQLAIAVLKSLEIQDSNFISKDERSQVVNPPGYDKLKVANVDSKE